MRAKASELTMQEQFIRKNHKRYQVILLVRILLLVVFLFFWEISANIGWIDSFFFSSPSRIVTLFTRLCNTHDLLRHIGITLLETFISFSLVFIISLIVSTLLWVSKSFSAVTEPYLVVLNSLPKSALAPLFIVWLGTGMKTIIVAGISVALFGSIISFYTGFQQCEPEKILLIRTLGGKKRDIFFKVVLPGSLTTLLATSKVNIGLSLVGVIIGEFLAARQGLGYLIVYGSQVFQLNLVITSIIILCVMAFGFYELVQLIEKHLKKNLGN